MPWKETQKTNQRIKFAQEALHAIEVRFNGSITIIVGISKFGLVISVLRVIHFL